MDRHSEHLKTLGMINRYRVVAPCALDGPEADSLDCELAQLERRGLLSRWRHASGIAYWTRRNCRPLSNNSLARAYGQLAYCPPTGPRKLLTASEIERRFHPLGRLGTASGYYCKWFSNNPKLGRLRVDTGSQLSRLVTASTRTVDQLRNTATRRLVDDHGFELTWLVATEAKRRRLLQELQPLSVSGVRFLVVAIPQLLSLLAPLQAES